MNDGATAYEKIMDYNPNISEYVQHKWYDWVYFNDPRDPDIQRLGRWLGPAHTTNQGMAYHCLTNEGNVVTRSTVVSLSNDELSKYNIKESMNTFITDVKTSLTTQILPITHRLYNQISL